MRRIKGPGRPILPQEGRSALLASLRAVDHVVVFDETTPARVLQTIRPHLVVKGDDYNLDSLPEIRILEDWGGQVVIIQRLPGYSTTDLINAIKK